MSAKNQDTRQIETLRIIATPVKFFCLVFSSEHVIARVLASSYDEAMQDILHRLMTVVADRKQNPPPRSYTSSLFAGGVEKIGAKVLEEAREVVDAAKESGEAGQQHLVNEAADLIYHLLVMLAHRDLTLQQVEQILAQRFGISGLDEKESRGQ